MAEEYQAKSAIIGKAGKANENDDYPIFINLFSENNPHKDANALPIKFLEFKEIHRIKITDLEINYLLAGSDILINDLKTIKIDVEGPHVYISGVQEK
ncbi:hypothetical protein C0585_03050 [Candidatus Woesearchaeota archaeon]|nr:MAG: hypothetical protein C0585_03050 [Candidatus Woesearchaeota archaeon]